MVYRRRGLSQQTQVLGVGELVDIADADKGGLAGEERLGSLQMRYD